MTTPSQADSKSAEVENINLPKHVAVIMDGNNRWSKLHSSNGFSGHRQGAIAARTITNLCADKKIDFLTLFVFSSENWLRPKKEVRGLMALFINVLKKKEVNKLHKRNIRVQFIGDRSRFSTTLQNLMVDAETLTKDNSGLTVIVAADYGGQWDIANAAKIIARKVAAGDVDPESIDEAMLQKYIANGDIPMPDLCIRTGGDHRISNFLLWQFAYTEFYFTDVFWPDFDEVELDLALAEFASRQRRFGQVSEQVGNT